MKVVKFQKFFTRGPCRRRLGPISGYGYKIKLALICEQKYNNLATFCACGPLQHITKTIQFKIYSFKNMMQIRLLLGQNSNIFRHTSRNIKNSILFTLYPPPRKNPGARPESRRASISQP